LRIGAILPHLYVFGGVRRYIELGNAFVSRGHEFVIYTPNGAGPSWIDFSGETASFDQIEKRRHDVLVCGSPELTGRLDEGRAGLRVFYLQVEGIPDEERIMRCGKYLIMVNSSGLARKVKKRYGIEPIDGIGGVNPDLFRPASCERRDGVFRVLCYGRLSRPRKGTRFVVEAVRRMHRRGCNVELQLFDSATPGSTDPRIGFDPGIPYRYYMNLPQSRMTSMYAAANVFVSVEHRAGWSNTSAEAAACGLPLVCTGSGTGDFAVDGVSAIVLPLRNSFAVARALTRLYNDGDLLGSLASRARSSILGFTWERLSEKIERAFEELLDRSRAVR
jgi:glycosyltransferase involved in cell wall biosynthesis